MEGPAQLIRKAKGQRPTFFDDPDTDKLVSMLMGLAGEVSVMRDRMDTVERLLGEKGLITQSDIDNFEPSEDVLMQRAETRELFLGEITRVITSELEDFDSDSGDSYEDIIEMVERLEVVLDGAGLVLLWHQIDIVRSGRALWPQGP